MPLSPVERAVMEVLGDSAGQSLFPFHGLALRSCLKSLLRGGLGIILGQF